MLDVSVGGFFATAARQVVAAEPLVFEFTSDEPGWRVQLRAALIYCERRDIPESTRPEYVHGFVFVHPDTPAVGGEIARLASATFRPSRPVAARFTARRPRPA